MSSKSIYHYVYRITNLVEGKHYYGKRSSNLHPEQDLGIRYFSSSRDKDFILDQKQNPQNYKYKIIKLFASAEEACEFEIKLHLKFNVGSNNNFYNLVTQTHSGFDSTGKILMEDNLGNRLMLSKDDPRYISGKFNICKVGFMVSGRIFTDEHRLNLSKSSKGKPKSKESIEKGIQTKREQKIQMGENHPRFKYYYHTPWGIFDSPKALEPDFTMSRMKNMCLHNEKKMLPSVYRNCQMLMNTFTENDINKTYKELGFYVIPKEEFMK